jgi:plastocyanin
VPHARRWSATLVLAPVLALAACGGSTPGSSATTPPAEHVAVVLTDFQIEPAQVSVRGAPAVLDVANRGRTPHNLSIRSGSGQVVGHTIDLAPGRSATLRVQLAAGTYTTFCSLAGHESLGMRGKATVGG